MGYAFNCTRRTYLATDLRVADTHWTRLRGLLATGSEEFGAGRGLWIVPCRGVHTLAMRFAIDVVYLDGKQIVVHIEEKLRPWRFAPVRMQAQTVLELPESTLRATGTAIGDQIEISRNAVRETALA